VLYQLSYLAWPVDGSGGGRARLARGMRRLALLLALLGALAAAGCGSDEKAPLDQTLAYFPKDAPLVASVETDPDGKQYKALDEIVDKLPFGDQAKRAIVQSLERDNRVDFEKDVKPLLGHPLVVGAPDVRTLSNDEDLLVAAKAKDGDKLKQLIEKSGDRKVGEKDGATLYRDDGGNVTALKGDVVLGGGDRRAIEAALDRGKGGEGLDEDAFEKGLRGLPRDALVRASGDLRAILRSDSGSAKARRVKWVDALRSFGATASARKDRIDVDFAVRTDPAGLGDADLPFASGRDAPRVVEQAGKVALGLRDPSQVIEFAERAGKAVDPIGFARYALAKRQIEREIGVSIDDDVVGQLTGDLSVDVAVDGSFGARAELKDPRAFKATLRKSEKVLPSVVERLGPGARLEKLGGGLYAISRPGGPVVFGVLNDVFVVASGAALAREVADGSPTAVKGAKGSVVIRANAEQVANSVLRAQGGVSPLGALGGAFVFAPLGELKGSVSSRTAGLEGSLTLGID
jgi:hypothetical protein